MENVEKKDTVWLEELLRVILEEEGTTSEEVFENMKEFVKLIDEFRDKATESGGFVFTFGEDYSVTAMSKSGWSTSWPTGSDTWMILSRWLLAGQTESIDAFVKIVVFPTSIRLADTDEEYFNDIMMAHARLTERNANKQ